MKDMNRLERFQQSMKPLDPPLEEEGVGSLLDQDSVVGWVWAAAELIRIHERPGQTNNITQRDYRRRLFCGKEWKRGGQKSGFLQEETTQTKTVMTF